MKKLTLSLMMLAAVASKAQEVKNDTIVQSLKETVDAHTEKFNGLDERLGEMSSDLSGLKKLKVSGYVQAEYSTYDWWNAAGTQHGNNVGGNVGSTTGAPSVQPANYVANSFYLRRARVKFVYEAVDGVNFVLCPNFDIDKVTLKDAFVQLNDRWTKTFSLWMGQFSRPTYEIEYSSGSREFAERSQVMRTLYPTERDQGAKLEANFATKYKFPLMVQVAAFNGNGGKGTLSNQVRDVDNKKDIMARAVYSLKMPNRGLGIDFGGHGYFGHNTVLNPMDPANPGKVGTMPTFMGADNKTFTPNVGDDLKQQWFGAELRAYWDFLGGVQLKSEYLAGTLSTFKNDAFPQIGYNTPGQATGTGTTNVNAVRNFNGYYVSLIKNIGKDHQLAARLDSFDPNTKLSGGQVSSANDIKYNNWSFAYQYFFNSNIKVQLTYLMPINEKSDNATLATNSPDFANRDKRDNTFTIRLQARF